MFKAEGPNHDCLEPHAGTSRFRRHVADGHGLCHHPRTGFSAVLDVLHVRDGAETVVLAQFPRELHEDIETTVHERLPKIAAQDETKLSLDLHCAPECARRNPVCKRAWSRPRPPEHQRIAIREVQPLAAD